MTFDYLKKRLTEEVLVLDGAMGTMIMRENLNEEDFRGESFKNHPVPLKGCNDILVISNPDVISKIHKAYLEAGADIISTDTFNANQFSLSDYQLSDRVSDICRTGAQIARKAVDDYCKTCSIPEGKRPLVAGSMGPTGLSLSIKGALEETSGFADLTDAYVEQAKALIEGGADVLLLETVFDILNAKAATFGIKHAFKETGITLPLIVSATLTPQGRLLSGQNIKQFVEAMSHSGAIAFGLNCSMGAKAMGVRIEELASVSPTFISMHPNAGLPDELGCYRETPERMWQDIKPSLEKGYVNIIGGCCGTTPDHIRLLANNSKSYTPHKLPESAESGNKFLKIGERCNVAGSRKFLRLVKEEKWSEAVDIAADQIKKGAEMLDINMDDSLLHPVLSMKCFVNLLYSDSRTAEIPLMIDSSDFEVVSEILPHLPLKGIVNSISLKNGEEEFLRRARYIYDMGCDMVVMGFDEQGQADTIPRRIEIFTRAYQLLSAAGIPAFAIIFDPNVLAVATGIEAHSRYALDFMDSVSWIKNNLPGVRISGGISNLSFAFRGIDPLRKAMHSVFLELAIERGMDMAIINPNTPLNSEWVDPQLRELILDLLLCRRKDATERMLAYAVALKKKIDEEKVSRSVKDIKTTDKTDCNVSVKISSCDALADALLSGDSSKLQSLLDNAITECNGSAMAVVEKALMKGMDKVGEAFGRGDIFLPQVVRSADVMKKAVNIITPLLEEEQIKYNATKERTGKKKVVLATVKGDVHDIGKNIVSIVLKCSGFEVVDLGVMTPPEKIVETALESEADVIALSGLITPSLYEMGVVARMMEERGMRIPLFVGGATTSDLHTAVGIAPLYSGPVVHTGDAASLPGAISEFTDSRSAKASALLRLKQHQLRNNYTNKKKENLISLDEARFKARPVKDSAQTPKHTGSYDIEIPIKELEPLINWRPLVHEWGLNPAEMHSEDALKLLHDAREMLQNISGSFKARVVILSARRDGDDIIADGNIRIPTIRSLNPNSVNDICYALSDFIADKDDHIALFAVTGAGSGMPEAIELLKTKGEYEGLLMQSIAHRLAEAATEWMNRYVRESLWGLPDKIGIRPAVGYSSLPDQSLVHVFDRWLNFSDLGIHVTENGALSPSATTTGIIIGHPEARYFDSGMLSEEALIEYSQRRGIDSDYLRKFLI